MPICHIVFENTAAKTHRPNLETRSESGRKKEARFFRTPRPLARDQKSLSECNWTGMIDT